MDDRCATSLFSAVHTTFRKLCGLAPRAGWCTYFLRPLHRISVARPISTPGRAKATLAPKCFRMTGISSDAKKLPKLMLQ